MQPRSKYQKRIVELSATLPPITDKQREWAREHCFGHHAYKCCNELWCSECSSMWVDTNNAKKGDHMTCPYCHHELTVKASRARTLKEESYMDIVTTAEEMQVVRHVYIVRYSLKHNETMYEYSEVGQHWIGPDAKVTIIAKEREYNHNVLRWKTHSPLSIKKRYGYYGDKYDIQGYVYQKIKVTPLLRRNGIKSSLHGLPTVLLLESLLKPGNKVEMLLKTKQYAMLEYYLYRGVLFHPWTVNICNRHGYRVKDGSMYNDYLHLLVHFGYDTHNPKYICPKNLKKAHDELLKRKEAKEAKERARRRREQKIQAAIKRRSDIAAFIRHIEPYRGLCIKGDGITIRPIESVTQMYQEGKVMHHCVFGCKYFAKADALILSATKEGERLETIEINLQTFAIVQSRGKHNGVSDYHNEIVNLVNQNIYQIKKRTA